MKRISSVVFVWMCMFFLLGFQPAHAVVYVDGQAQVQAVQATDHGKADLENLLGRKLTFKEKVAWKINQKLQKKRLGVEEDLEKKADTAFKLSMAALIGFVAATLLSIIIPAIGAIAFLSLIPAILGVVWGKKVLKSRDWISTDAEKKAKQAVLFGWIAIGLQAFLVLLGLAFAGILLLIYFLEF